MQQSSLGGAHYLSNGLSLIWQPGVKRFVFIPLIINIILLSVATIYAFNHLSDWYLSLQSSDSSIVQWIVNNLDWLLWPIIVIVVFIVIFFLFAFLANWIAAPFNGLLSEAVEKHLRTQHKLPRSASSEPTRFSSNEFIGEVPRLIGREWRKLTYYAPRAIGCLILFFVPPIAILAPFIWFFFNAWMAVIQYVDYPMDNHKVPFDEMLKIIKQKKSTSFSFGALIMLLTMIPLVNIVLMPIAVAGATSLWFDHYRQDH